MLRLIVVSEDGSFNNAFDNLLDGGIGPVGTGQFDLQLSTKSTGPGSPPPPAPSGAFPPPPPMVEDGEVDKATPERTFPTTDSSFPLPLFFTAPSLSRSRLPALVKDGINWFPGRYKSTILICPCSTPSCPSFLASAFATTHIVRQR